MNKVHKVRRLQIGEKVVDQAGGASPAFSVLWQQLVANSDTLDSGKIDKSQDLTSLSKAKWTGIAVRVGSDSWTGRTLQAGTGISITNLDGIAGDPTITCTVSAYTDEQAQDAVGTILTDTATIDFTYNDAGNQITADVKAGSIGTTQLANTAVTAGSYTSADITVDAQGRITAAANGAGGGGGSGTVTSVSVVTANGVSGSVATSTTTPAITLTLGAITPSSVAATGTVTGSNLSGTNTGNQTITLTGDVTGSGTGSFAATLAASGATAATYGDSTHVPQIAVDAKGRITSASNVAISGGGGATGEASLSVPAATDYTLQNTGTSSASTVSNGIYLSVPSTSPAQIRFLKNTAGPGSFSSFTIIARCKMAAIVSTTAASYIGAIVLRNSGTGKILIFSNAYQGGSQYLMQRWTNYATFSANVLGPTAYGGAAPAFYWMKVTVGSGTATFYLSPDGVNWASVGTETVATFIGSIDEVGVGSMSNGTDASCVFSSISVA